MAWTLLTKPPKKSGRYIVAHRGTADVIYYLAPGEKLWCEGAKLGWQRDPREFGATHYMPLPEITMEQSAASEVDLSNRRLNRCVHRVRDTFKRIPAATKWELFKAMMGWEKLPDYPSVKIQPPAPKAGDMSDPRYIVTIAPSLAEQQGI